MTDRRVTDLSYGHFGEASYDLDEQTWLFSRRIAFGSSIQPIQPLQQCTPPSLPVPRNETKRPSQIWHTQNRRLTRTLPETGSASGVLSYLRQTPSTTSEPNPSDLLAVGYAADVQHMSRSRTIQILAMPCGEAGHVLRLIKPRAEAHGWDGRHGTKLRLLNPTSSEACYWLGDGGAIQQISFGAESGGPSSWLAVRKLESTTILRPIYRPIQIPSSISKSSRERYPPSSLNANPILTLKNETTGAAPHADVSFNPWYIRQFAIVDQRGNWTIWNIEGRKQKRTTFEAVPGRSGHIRSDLLSDQSVRLLDADGWGQVMWAGGVNTLIICDRRNIAVFDVNATPKRLHTPELVDPKSTSWILGAKRSPVHLNRIFVLTSTEIFWLQITTAGEDGEERYGKTGARVLLSCRHFRDEEDETIKFDLFKEDDDCMVVLYSARSLLVNTYRFGMTSEGSTLPAVSQGSFIISNAPDEQSNPSDMIQTMCALPTTFILHNLNPISGQAREYFERDIHFYQLFSLSVSLGLSHALCATRHIVSGRSRNKPVRCQTVLAPRANRAGNVRSSARVIEDQFIVPDDLDEAEDIAEHATVKPLVRYGSLHIGQRRTQSDLSISINARRLFEVSFLDSQIERPLIIPLLETPQTITKYVTNIVQGLQDRKEHGQQGLTTFLDLAGYTSFLGDVDEAASTLQELMYSLGRNEEDDSIMAVTLLSIKPSPFTEPKTYGDFKGSTPNLSDIYDELVDLWVSCLPHKTPGPARLAKEKLVRSIATELCLSSLVASIRDPSVLLPEYMESREEVEFVLPLRAKPDLFGQVDSQDTPDPSSAPGPGLPTPATTPSAPSNDKPTPFGEPLEDGAISRLRGYALSIKSQPPLGTARSAILAQWPSNPGADPSKYSWEATGMAAARDEDLDSDDEEAAFIRQREEARRRRRSEKFLKRQRVNTLETISQPTPIILFGSRPDPVQHVVSSQGGDIPMTQPDRGMFGSRLGQKASKKRRTIGF